MGQIKDYLESKKKETVTRSLAELHAAARASVGNRASGSVSTLSGTDREQFDNDVRQNYAARQTASAAQKTAATATQEAGRYYSQPAIDPAVNRLGNSLEVYKKNVEQKEAALNSANANAKRLYNSLKELENQGTRLGQYSTSKLAMAKLNEVKEQYQQTYQQYEQAAQKAQSAYGEYTPAWEQYAAAAKDFETSYAAQQKAYIDWKSTVRTDENAIAAELEGAKKTVEALKEQKNAAGKQKNSTTSILETPNTSGFDVDPGLIWKRQEEETTRREQEKKLTAEISQAEAEVERLQEELDWRKYFNYANLAEKADFAEKSQYKSTANGQEERNPLGGYRNTGFDDIDYDYINKNETAISRKGLNDVQSNASFLGVDKSERGEMTEEEIAIFNYLYAQDTAKGDAEHKSAYGYIDYLTKSLNQRKRNTEQEKWAGYAKEHPVRASAFSVLENPLKGLSYIGQAADYLDDGAIDQNAGYNRFSQMNTAIRGQVSQMAEDRWGAPGSFLYQTGMSMADFLYNSLLTGAIGGEAMLGKTGAKAAGNIALAIMGTGAAADATIEAKDRGLTDGQAFALGTIAGLAEIITEKVSVEALFNGDWEKGALRYIIKNVVSEGSEEVASDLINLFADVLISKDKSQWQAALEEYKADGKTEEEAFWLAVKDQGLEMGVDFLGGALSGGVMAGAGAAIGKAGAAISQRGEQRKTATGEGNMVAEMTAGGYTEGNTTGKEGMTNGQRAESKEDFYRRGMAEGLSYLERNEGGYAFQRVRYPAGSVAAERYSPAQGIQRELSALGISSDIIEGELQRNHKGVTTTLMVEEAATADRGHIFINKNTTLNPRNVAGHEAFHLWGNSETRTAYEAVLRENLIFSGEAFREYQAKATAKYFEGEADLSDSEQAALLFEEIFAYISGDLHEGSKEGTLREILRDYDAVKAAWEQLVQENGNGNKEVTDYGTEEWETDLHRGGMAGGLPNLDGNEGGGTVQRVQYPAGAVAAGRDGTVEGKQVNRAAARQPRVAEVTAEGNIVMPRGGETGEFYLPTAKQEEILRRSARAQTETERTGILAGASEDAIEQAQRLGQMIGREVVFYSEASDSLGNLRNGFYDPTDGRIYVNTQSGNPLPQIVAHELTHSLEESGSYRDLERLVLKRLQQQGSLDALRQAYQELYARSGVELDTRGVDQEIVAAYVEKHLLTNEGEIRNIVSGNRTLGQRILTFLNQLLGKLGNENAAERAFLLKARSIYEAALEESHAGAEELSRRNANRRGMEELREQLRRGEISEEEAEARFNDLYDPEEDLERRERGVKNSFGGEKARNANLNALEKAKEMQKQGVAEETIFRETGWYVGADGKWRFEIDDSGMEFRKDGDARLLEEDGYRRLQELTDKWGNSFADGEALSEAEQTEMEQLQEEYSEAVWEEKFRLTDFLKHDELFEQYPRLRGVSLVFDSLGNGERGYFSKRSNTIVLSDSLFGKEADVLVHEIQHILQRYEGFATGSSPVYWEKRMMEEGFSKRDSRGIELMPSELYRNTAGEIEARDVTARRELSKEQRREKMPDRGGEDTVFVEENGESFDFVGKTADGTEVYETSEEVRKMPTKQRMKVFESLMRNEYRGRTAKFVSGSEVLYAKFDERDISKNIYGDKRSSPRGWKAKVNVGADGNIFELVENAKHKGNAAETGKKSAAHQSVSDWEYFVKTVQIDNQVFDLLANIRKKPDGEYVYSIQLNENKNKAPTPPVAPAYNDKDLSNGYASEWVLTDASEDSIVSEAENVKDENAGRVLEPEFSNPAWREAAEAGRQKRYSIKNTSDMTLAQQLKMFYDGKMASSDAFYFGETPTALKKAGFETLPLAMTTRDFRKSTKEKHNIPRRVLKNLMNNLAHPLFSFGSGDRAGVILDDIDGDGHKLLAALERGTNMDRKPVNVINSLYGLEHPAEWLKNQIDSGNDFVLYDEKRANAFLQTYGYSASVEDGIRSTGESITQNSWEVKGENAGRVLEPEFSNPAWREAAEAGREKRYSISPTFREELREWDGKAERTFRVGTTSEALQSIGVKDRGIIWHSRKIAEILRKHSGMTLDIIEQVPTVLENPIIVLKSKQSESRIVTFGELTDKNGAPVTAVVELLPTTKGGELLDMNVIASAYGKDSSPGRLIQNSDVLYLDENKNRTQKWLQGLGLQLPSDTTKLGSVGSIAYQSEGVKIQGVPFDQLVDGEETSTGVLEPEFSNPAWREAAEAGREQRRKNRRERYWKPKLNRAEWQLLNRNMERGLSNARNTLDEGTKWVYASENGTQVFALYGVGDGAEGTVLYAAGGNRAETEYWALIEREKEYDHGVDRDRKGLNRLLEAARNRERNGDGGLYVDGYGGKTAGYDGISAQQGESDGRGSVEYGPGDGESRNSLNGATELLERMERIAEEAKAEGWSYEKQRAKQQEAVREVYQKLIDEYGAMKPGEKAAREIEVPKKSGKGERVYQTVRTILEGQATPDEMVPRIQELVDKGELSYEALSDKKAIERAENVIQSKGWAETYADWMKDSQEGKISKEHTALGWALYNNAANSGNTEVAIGILMAVVGNQHDAAQAVQATRIFKQLTPEGQFYGIVQSVERMQQELNQKYGDEKTPRLRVDEELGEEFLSAEAEERRRELNQKYGGKKVPRLRIDEELGAEFLSAETEEQRDEARKNIYRDIGRQMPSRFRDRWNAWRYLSMLGNTRTHVRNIFGNFFFAPVVAVKDTVATGMEAAVGKLSKGKLERTKGLAGLNTELAKAAWDDYAKAAPAIMDGGKYGDLQNANKFVEEGRKVFGNTRFEVWNKTGGKVLETLRKENGKWLDREDAWFAKPHYVAALSQYCDANHITAEQLREGKLPAVEKARSYAIREAQKATYRDCNELSDFFSSLGSGLSSSSSKVNRAMGIAVEGILPFRKTPANILARGLEYSPAGLIKSLTYDLVEVSKGNMTGAEAIDHISAGLTGTGLFALGMAAAAAQVVRGHGSGDEEENEFEELMGHQSYALELPNGTSVTLDWLAPECLPFFVGVNLQEQLRAENGELSLSMLLNAATTVTEPLLEMSCLQSLNAIFDAVGYAKSDGLDGLPAALASAATSYLTQAVPTLAGQLERIGEDKRYTTYTGKNSMLTSDMQYTLGKLSAKVPGVDYSQIPYIDAWGRMEETGSLGTRAVNNLVNPAYVSQIDTSEMEEELLRLYKATGETSVFPSRAAKYINVDGERMDLTGEEYVQYATLKGQKSYELLSELVNSKLYQAMDDEKKAEAVAETYSLANQLAKEAVSNYKPKSSRYNDFVSAGLDDGTAYRLTTTLNALEPEDGKENVSNLQKYRAILDDGLNDEKTMKALSAVMPESEYAKLEVGNEFGVTAAAYVVFKEQLPQYDADGNGSYSQEEVENAIDSLGCRNGIMLPGGKKTAESIELTREEKAALWQMVNKAWKGSSNPYSKKVGKKVCEALNAE